MQTVLVVLALVSMLGSMVSGIVLLRGLWCITESWKNYPVKFKSHYSHQFEFRKWLNQATCGF